MKDGTMLNIINNDKNKVKKIMAKLGFKNIYNIDWNLETEDDCSIFEEAVYAGFSEEDLLILLNYAIKHGMNINKRTNMYGDTYMHTVIESDDYTGRIAPFLYFGYLNGFNPDIKNFKNKTVWDVLKKPDTTKKINQSDRKLCFQIKKLYEAKEKQAKVFDLKNQKKVLEQQIQELEQYIDDNKELDDEIIKALRKIK